MDMLLKVLVYLCIIVGILTIALLVIEIITAVAILTKEALGIESFSFGGRS